MLRDLLCASRREESNKCPFPRGLHVTQQLCWDAGRFASHRCMGCPEQPGHQSLCNGTSQSKGSVFRRCFDLNLNSIVPLSVGTRLFWAGAKQSHPACPVPQSSSLLAASAYCLLILFFPSHPKEVIQVIKYLSGSLCVGPRAVRNAFIPIKAEIPVPAST